MPHSTRQLLPLSLLLALLLPLGCAEPLGLPTDPVPNDPPAPLATHFDPATTGTLRGRVIWDGDLPKVPRLEVPAFVEEKAQGKPRLWFDNPHAPAIDPGNRGVANAVIFLKGVNPAKSRPWNHAAVTLEQRDSTLLIVQGAAKSPIGFVRRGAEIDMVSRDKPFRALHLNGAAFLTLAFPDPDQP